MAKNNLLSTSIKPKQRQRVQINLLTDKSAEEVVVTEWLSCNGVVNYNINDVLNRQQNRPRNPTTTVPKKEKNLSCTLFRGEKMKLLPNSLRPAFINFMAALILGWFSRAALIAASPFFPTKIRSTVPKCQKLFIRLVVGTARVFTLKKQKVDCMTEKRDHKYLSCICYRRPRHVNIPLETPTSFSSPRRTRNCLANVSSFLLNPSMVLALSKTRVPNAWGSP